MNAHDENPGNKDDARTIRIILAVLASPFLLTAIWLFLAFNNKYRTCIPLKNGANLGFEAVFDLSRDFFKPIAVPKLADGTPIIRDDTWALYITDTTLYGLTFTGDADRDYRFAWRMDLGLVPEYADPGTYEVLLRRPATRTGISGREVTEPEGYSAHSSRDLISRQKPVRLR